MNTFRILPSLATLFKAQRIGVIKIESKSMEPTYREGRMLLAADLSKGSKKRDKRLAKLKVGDVVVLERESQLMIKRIKRIFKAEHSSEMMIWVEGDNQLDSVDSRTWGPVPLDLVVSKVLS